MLDIERHHLIEEACGIVGVINQNNAAHLTHLGLHALQHRGQESSGIAAIDDRLHLSVKRFPGLVSQGWTPEAIDSLPGCHAIGHVRYSTAGDSTIENAQPIVIQSKFGPLAVAHNGHLINSDNIRQFLIQRGVRFSTTTDTEVIAHLIDQSTADNLSDAMIEALEQVEGAYCLLCLTTKALFVVRDPLGIRPLVLGQLGDAVVVASESSCLSLFGARMSREIMPGEMLAIDFNGKTTSRRLTNTHRTPQPCVFELIYFGRSDSRIFDRDVYHVRHATGVLLATEHPICADVVIAVPDSATPAAIGFAQQSGIPFQQGITRNNYAGRSFIVKEQQLRINEVKRKLSAIPSVVKSKRVVIVDDSMVRGTTMREVVKMIKYAGASQVHVRIASPPILAPCYYGIDTPDRSELLAFGHSRDAIRRSLEVDSVEFLSLYNLREAAGATITDGKATFCEACFTGNYPTPIR